MKGSKDRRCHCCTGSKALKNINNLNLLNLTEILLFNNVYVKLTFILIKAILGFKSELQSTKNIHT